MLCIETFSEDVGGDGTQAEDWRQGTDRDNPKMGPEVSSLDAGDSGRQPERDCLACRSPRAVSLP